MGYILHHAVIVSSWDEKKLADAHAKALAIFDATGAARVTSIAPTVVNGGGSFMVAPDGSKEGWTASQKGDEARTAFLEWINAQRYGDGSSSFSWAEVALGADDDTDTAILRHRGNARRFL